MSPKSPLPIAIAITLMVAPLVRAEPPLVLAQSEFGGRFGDAPRRPPERAPPPREEPPSDSSSGCGFLCILGVVVAGAVVADALTGDHWASREELDRDGPRFPNRLAPGQFQVQGYAAPGWPVVLDFDAPTGADTALEVNLEGFDPRASIHYPLEPAAGRRVVVMMLPNGGGFDRVLRARFTLVSTFRSGGGRAPAPLSVYGIGAGPRAVGSMTIAIEQLQPLDAPRPDAVSFVLDAMHPFDRSVTEILRLPRGDQGDLTLVRDARAFPLTLGPHDGRWASMRAVGSETPGLYILQARAWLVGARNDERDWTGAFGPGPIRLR